jgi:predicted AAA+ superfamily ATPase
MKEFGRTAYKNAVYVSFDNNPQMAGLFSADSQIDRIITGLEIYARQKIDANTTLLVFDEIQEVPRALLSLKYFNENAPQYQIVCAGSMLGVALHSGTSFPVGKTEFLDLYPMSFTEFLMALEKEDFAALVENADFEMAATFGQDLGDLLKHYYFVGGMPEVVGSFAANRDFNEAREIQARLLATYEQEFSKHAPNDAIPRIRMLWNCVPSQLARENRKFVYGLVREGARAKDYEMALLWLSDCGLVHKVHRVTAPSLPLKAYEDMKAFKLYLLDVGLLGCMTRLDQKILLSGCNLFKEFKGALTEQYVLQQLKTIGKFGVYYWTNDRNSAEVDFLLDFGGEVVPVEVKAEQNLQAKSLKIYNEKFNPRRALRMSMSSFKADGRMIDLPLWGVEGVMKLFHGSRKEPEN